jgi:hypothetical protein
MKEVTVYSKKDICDVLNAAVKTGESVVIRVQIPETVQEKVNDRNPTVSPDESER